MTMYYFPQLLLLHPKGRKQPLNPSSSPVWLWCVGSHHAQVPPVVVLADDVSDTAQGGTGVLVDGDLLVRAHGLALTCRAESKRCRVNTGRKLSPGGLSAPVGKTLAANTTTLSPQHPVSAK